MFDVSVFLIVFLTYACRVAYCHDISSSPLLIVSLNGLRYDLYKVKNHQTDLRNLQSLIAKGVTVASTGVVNVYPSDTYPTHFSIVTGMYPEKHGVVANCMLDPRNRRRFSADSFSDLKDPFWFDNGTSIDSSPVDPSRGDSSPVDSSPVDSSPVDSSPHSSPVHRVEPIWVRNELERDRHRHSGVFFWPGSEAPYQDNTYPYHFEPRNSSMQTDTVITTLTKWFTDPQSPINLGLLFYNKIAETGAKHGPDSPEMHEIIVETDQLIGKVIDQLKSKHLFDKMNIIITGGHGMLPTVGVTAVDKFVNVSSYQYVDGRTFWNVLPNDGKEDEVFSQFQLVPNVSVYKRQDIPGDYHYRYNSRILPLLVVAHPGFVICHEENSSCKRQVAEFGYNNSLPEMHPIFIAHGPSFKKHYTAPVFESVDIYPLLCHLLGLRIPDDIDGRLTRISNILLEDDEDEDKLFNTFIVFLVIVAFAAMVTGVISLAACHVYRITRTRRRPYKTGNNVKLRSTDAGNQRLLQSDDEI